MYVIHPKATPKKQKATDKSNRQKAAEKGTQKQRVDKITPAPPPLTSSSLFSVTAQQIQSKVETGAPP